jgi:hypothetical protein
MWRAGQWYLPKRVSGRPGNEKTSTGGGPERVGPVTPKKIAREPVSLRLRKTFEEGLKCCAAISGPKDSMAATGEEEIPLPRVADDFAQSAPVPVFYSIIGWDEPPLNVDFIYQLRVVEQAPTDPHSYEEQGQKQADPTVEKAGIACESVH